MLYRPAGRRVQGALRVHLNCAATVRMTVHTRGAGACVSGSATPTCNISFDQNGQPVSTNNAFCDWFSPGATRLDPETHRHLMLVERHRWPRGAGRSSRRPQLALG
jgi:hypothetical protein